LPSSDERSNSWMWVEVEPAWHDSRSMSDEAPPPTVSRYNPWGLWQPFAFSTMDAYMSFVKECKAASADPDVEASVAYARATGHDGIEFVLLSTYWDSSRTRTYGGGITVVRLSDVPP